MINSSKFFDNYFKLLVLLFWPMIWYKWTIISDYEIDLILVITFCVLAIIFLLLFLYYSHKHPEVENIVLVYRITMLLAFISTLFSFILFPKSVSLLLIKMIFIGICFYYSCIKVFRYKMDEGLVGILSCLLLFAITLLY